jgi:hypothetical protein
LSDSGVQGQTHPRLTDRERVKQEKLKKKELDAAKQSKKKDKKQEKVDNDKRARERGEGGRECAGLLCGTCYYY